MTDKKVKIRKILYVICFMLLNLVEWLKGTQGGGIWLIGVNFTGVIMMGIILSGWPVKELINKSNGIFTVLCGAGLAGVYLYWHDKTGYQIITAYLLVVVDIWLMGILVLHLLGKLKKGEFSVQNCRIGLLGVLWLVFSVISVLSASDKVWPIWFFLMFGLFYLTDLKEDMKTLTDSMLTGTLLSFVLIQGFAFGLRPYDEIRYKGAFSNCNMTALYYLIIYCMILIKVHFMKCTKEGKKYQIVLWLAAAGVMLAFQFLTLCRTAWMSSALLTAVYALCVMRRIRKETWFRIVGQCALILVCAVLSFPAVFAGARWLPTILHRPVWFEGEWSVNKVHSFDPADSEKYVEMDEFLHTAFDRFYQILELLEAHDPLVMKVHAAQEGGGNGGLLIMAKPEGTPSDHNAPILKGNKEWTSAEIRAAIYKIYWENLNLTGHTAAEGHYQITDNYHAWHAQNLWLQATHDFGIPAGILLIIMTLLILGRLLIGFAKRTIDSYYGVIPLLFTVLFFSFGVMEIVWNAGQLVLFLFFFAQHPRFYGKK